VHLIQTLTLRALISRKELGANGFTNGVGPGNVGFSLNLNRDINMDYGLWSSRE
jgi:hypothetical protein